VIPRATARAVTLTAASVAISAGADTGVVISTPDAVFRVDDNGISTTLAGALPAASARHTVEGYGPPLHPVRPVDANAAGELLLITGNPVSATRTTDAATPWHFDGGSGRFRELVEDGGGWSGAQDLGDFVLTDATGVASPTAGALRSGRLGVWTADSEYVIVVPGSGDESALARITLPAGQR
jgi:hypothetical protein